MMDSASDIRINSETTLAVLERVKDSFGSDVVDASTGMVLTYEDKVNRLLLYMSEQPQAEIPTEHLITPGLYTRQASADAGTLLVSKKHSHDHQFIMSKGVCWVFTEDGSALRLEAPLRGITKAGSVRVVWCEQDTVWTSIHATTKTNLREIEAEIFTDHALALSDNPDHQDFFDALDELGVSPEVVRARSEDTRDIVDLPSEYLASVDVKDSLIQGKGVFAKRDFVPDEVIAPALLVGLRTPLDRFCNHAKHPNAIMRHDGGGNVSVVALEPIPTLHEITVDYRKSREVASHASLNLNNS